MRFENTYTMNFEGAFRGLRNPLESWEKSDSYFGLFRSDYDDYVIMDIATIWAEKEASKTNGDESELCDHYVDWLYSEGTIRFDENCIEYALIGPKDMDLAQRMIRAGSSDRKFLRQILVSVDVTAPLYWWKEMDQYKVGTVTNSTSTMHKLASTPISKNCFEMDDYTPHLSVLPTGAFTPDDTVNDCWRHVIEVCEKLRLKYQETKDKKYWKELIRILPEGWLQTRTITMNYEILRNIYSQRKTHKLTEWHSFCSWIKDLPYAKELITLDLD